MRLFIAIKFSPQIEEKLTNLQNNLKEKGITGNYTNCKNFHLTLAFIGEYDDPDKVLRALGQIDFEPFRLFFEEEMGNFGDIVWVGTKENSDLMSLNQCIRKALNDYRIHYDRKKFKPHITIIRKVRLHSKLKNHLRNYKLENAEMIVDKFSLMQSQRIDGQLVYTELGYVNSNKKTV